MLSHLLLLLALAFLGYALFGWFLRTRLPSEAVHTPTKPELPVLFWEYGVAAAIVLLALAIRWPSMSRGLGYDEIASAMAFIEVDSVRTTMSSYSVFNNHIAYSILAHFSEVLLGKSEWALRLPALLLGLMSIVSLWIFARRLAGARVALAAALILALSPAHVRWSVSARGYTGLILCTLLSSHIYLRLLNGERKGISIYVLVSVLGIYFHLYAAVVTAVQALFLIFLAGRQWLAPPAGGLLDQQIFRRLWRAFGIIAFLSLICYLPVIGPLMFFIRDRGRGDFQPGFPLRVMEAFAGSRWMPIVPLAALVIPAGVFVLKRTHPRGAGYLLVLLLIPLCAVWLSRPYDLYPRFLVFYLPCYCFLLALVLASLWQAGIGQPSRLRRLGLRSLSAILATLFVCAWMVDLRGGVPEEEYRSACRFLEADCTDSTTVCAIGGTPQLCQYYCRKRLVFPQSVDEARNILDRSSDFRCVYVSFSWEPAEQTNIKEWLAPRAKVRSFDNIAVFAPHAPAKRR